jgi:hypothetical protein
LRFGIRSQQGVEADEIAQDPQLANPLGLEPKERRTFPVYRPPGRPMTTKNAQVDSGKSHPRERLLTEYSGEDDRSFRLNVTDHSG